MPAFAAGEPEEAVAGADRVYRTELTPSAFLVRAQIVYARRTAVLNGDGRLTYRELAQRALRLGSSLRAAGVRVGDRVALLAPNTLAALEAHFGVPASGGVLVALNTRLSQREIETILSDCEPRAILVDAEYARLLPRRRSPTRVIEIADTGAPDDPYEELLASGDPQEPPVAVRDEEQPISINYTSGTTGRPKGAVYTHRGAYLNALSLALETGLRPESVFLHVVPLFHCNGWCFPWAVTAAGASHVCLRKVDPERVWGLIDRVGVTHTNGAPTVHVALTTHPAAHPVGRPVTVVIAGAPPSPTLLARMAELGFEPIHVYGLTESYGPFTRRVPDEGWSSLALEERARLLARQGQAHVGADLVRVVDEQLRDVPWDGATMGEVVMRGNLVMQGYFRQPEATAEAFRGGWFHSGDTAVHHPDGAIELRDRKKDIIVSGGENIPTIEVEQVVTSHPAVLECAVVATPDDFWGERPKAYVALRPGATATEAEIIEHCRERLAHFKCPAAVEFGDLPKTSTGKIQKFVLREREWAGRERRIN